MIRRVKGENAFRAFLFCGAKILSQRRMEMKKRKMALAVILCAVFFSTLFTLAGCSAESKLIGTWEADNGASITFQKDGKAYVNGITDPMRYTIEGKKLLMGWNKEDIEEYKYTINGKKLTLAPLFGDTVVFTKQ
jgi:hypothetical protein